MPNIWIKRDISGIIESNPDPIQVIRGPRQCGKSSLALHLGQNFTEISLDDPGLRALAQSDPQTFLAQFEGRKIFIDEAQYAPELFPVLKRRADLYKRTAPATRETIIRITGSNQILLDRNVKESLAGRASFFDMNTLSVNEILKSSHQPIQQILYSGGWPELYASVPKRDPKKYLDDYINSYIERDIVISAGIQKQAAFLKLVKLLAGRIGQILDLSQFGQEVGVDAKTVKDWISVLEQMRTIALVPPYSTNLSKRLIKSPKIYFMGWEIFHWRSRDKEEIDFLINMGPDGMIFIESKVSAQRLNDLDTYPEVRKVFKSNPPRRFLCHMTGEFILGPNVPIAKLGAFLLGLKSSPVAP